MSENEVNNETTVERITGKVARIVADRGYGFITTENGPDYFLHMRQVSKFSVPFRNFKVGDSVVFSRFDDPKGPQAHDVMLVVE